MVRTGNKNPRWSEIPSRNAVHRYIGIHFERTNQCENCEKLVKRTEWAFKHHPYAHTRDRDDYFELCVKCHKQYDTEGRRQRDKELIILREKAGFPAPPSKSQDHSLVCPSAVLIVSHALPCVSDD